jgi:Holliday junction resolvasome RuvABC ATP-dependent DNA helicase subunit
MTETIVTGFVREAALKPLPPASDIFNGLVLGKNTASFRRVEEIVNDCRTKALVSNLALIGVPSSGKTTTAQIVAKALQRPFYEGSALNFEGKPADAFLDMIESVFGEHPAWALKNEFVGHQQITTIKPCVVFLDEAHDLPPKSQSILLQLLEKPYRVNINGILLDGSQIMWIFGTTDFSLLQVPLQTRTTPISFVGYALDEIAQMVHHRVPKFSLEDSLLIAKAAKGYPRQAFKIADFLAMRDLSAGMAPALLHWYEVDADGLDAFDNQIIEILRSHKNKGTSRMVNEAKRVVEAHQRGDRVGATALAKAQSYLDSLKEYAPMSLASLAEKLKYTDQSDLHRRVVYLETLNLVTRDGRGIKAI